MIQQLLDKKVAFISGKGGTGKTTLAAALAILAARRRKRVLLVEVDMTRPSIEDIFGKKLGFKPTRLTENLDAINVEFFEALHAYLSETIPVELLVSTILKNKVVRYFLESTPFAREISFLNTFYHYYERAINGGQYDLVIIDLPATGHALPILGVPENVFRMFRIGPLLKRAQEMHAFLADQRRVAISLVTLPEDMPVNETIEVYARIQQELPLGIGPLFINRLPVEDFSDEEGALLRRVHAALPADAPARVNALLAAGEEAVTLSQRTRFQIDRLRQSVQTPFCTVRELEEPHTEPVAFRVARTLEQML